VGKTSQKNSRKYFSVRKKIRRQWGRKLYLATENEMESLVNEEFFKTANCLKKKITKRKNVGLD